MAAENRNVKSFNTGDVIFREGDEGNAMYILVEGSVDLKKKVEKGETVLKTVNVPNEFFGEMALIDDRPRSATAIAAAPTKLIEVDEATFENLVVTNGKFALKVIKVLSERIRSSNVQIGELIETVPRERILRGMVDYALQHGEKIFNGGIKINIEAMKASVNSRLGIAMEDVDAYIFRLLKQNSVGYAPTSAKTRESIVLSPDFIKANDRRGN
jgi:CRP/FNR family transcriptional regulator, cyclic AMP receptor protein